MARPPQHDYSQCDELILKGGMSDSQIANAVGISRVCVYHRRKKLSKAETRKPIKEAAPDVAAIEAVPEQQRDEARLRHATMLRQNAQAVSPLIQAAIRQTAIYAKTVDSLKDCLTLVQTIQGIRKAISDDASETQRAIVTFAQFGMLTDPQVAAMMDALERKQDEFSVEIQGILAGDNP